MKWYTTNRRSRIVLPTQLWSPTLSAQGPWEQVGKSQNARSTEDCISGWGMRFQKVLELRLSFNNSRDSKGKDLHHPYERRLVKEDSIPWMVQPNSLTSDLHGSILSPGSTPPRCFCTVYWELAKPIVWGMGEQANRDSAESCIWKVDINSTKESRRIYLWNEQGFRISVELLPTVRW